ncbi:MAG: hypothetical protein ABI401_16840 [Candidatus Dormibacter sp.]
MGPGTPRTSCIEARTWWKTLVPVASRVRIASGVLIANQARTTRQYPARSSASGTRNAICGFNISAASARPASHGRPRDRSHQDKATAATTSRLTWPKSTPTKTGRSAAAATPWIRRASVRPGAVRIQTTTKAIASTPTQIQPASAYGSKLSGVTSQASTGGLRYGSGFPTAAVTGPRKTAGSYIAAQPWARPILAAR